MSRFILLEKIGNTLVPLCPCSFKYSTEMSHHIQKKVQAYESLCGLGGTCLKFGLLILQFQNLDLRKLPSKLIKNKLLSPNLIALKKIEIHIPFQMLLIYNKHWISRRFTTFVTFSITMWNEGLPLFLAQALLIHSAIGTKQQSIFYSHLNKLFSPFLYFQCPISDKWIVSMLRCFPVGKWSGPTNSCLKTLDDFMCLCGILKIC